MTESLRAAQRASSPQYRASVTAAARSAGGLAGGAAWTRVDALPEGLAAWNSQSIAIDAAANESGVMRLFLSHLEGELACQWCSGDETDAETWVASGLTTIATFTPAVGIDTPKPALVWGDGAWHAFYLLPSGSIFHRASADNGVTWSSADALYAGGDGYGDLFALYLPNEELFVLQFSTQTDAIRMRGLAGNPDSGWEIWAALDDERGWTAAGMVDLGAGVVRQFCVAHTAAPVEHFLGTIDCTLDVDGALAARSDAVNLQHYVAGAAPIRPTYQALGSGFGGVWMTQQVGGATRTYLCGGALLANQASGTLLPVEAMPVDAQPLGATPLERHTIALDRGDRTLLVGLGAVYRSEHLATSVSDAQVVAYRYTVTANGAGIITLALRRGSALAAVRPGYGLWLTRSCSKGEEGGSVTLGFEVTRVEVGTDRIEIEAVDALGLLETTRALQPFHVGAGHFSKPNAAALICARAGVGAEVDLADEDALEWHWRAGENGLSALARFLALDAVELCSRVAGVAALPYARIAAAGEAEDPYSYSNSYGEEGHPIVRFAQYFARDDARLMVVRGPNEPNLPEYGEDWALAGSSETLAPARRSAVITREERAIGGAAMENAVEALAVKMKSGVARATLVAQANLALETHDLIEVNEQVWRVEAFVETWEEGRCVQHVEFVRE